MSIERNKQNKIVNKIYEASDYNSNDEESKGLADTHEQVSDSYITGDVFTQDPAYQNKRREIKEGQ